MKPDNKSHLHEDLITRAVIDEQDLDDSGRQHLMTCRTCSEKVRQIKDELQELGENALLAVEPARKAVVLPREKPAAAGNASSWLPTFGVAVMACLVLFFYFLGMESMSPRLTPYQSADALVEDEYLMEEISEMVEYPLSETLYEITGDNDVFDDDFFQFMVPDIQEDLQSEYLILGGITLC